jgi:hypothetical protein
VDCPERGEARVPAELRDRSTRQLTLSARLALRVGYFSPVVALVACGERSKRSRFIASLHAATKSRTKADSESLQPYNSEMVRRWEFEPKTKSAAVAVHLGWPVPTWSPWETSPDLKCPGAKPAALSGHLPKTVTGCRKRAVHVAAVQFRPDNCQEY